MSTSRELDELRSETMAGVNSRCAIKVKILILTFLECFVTEFVYANTIILFSLGEKLLNKLNIHLDFIEYLFSENTC